MARTDAGATWPDTVRTDPRSVRRWFAITCLVVPLLVALVAVKLTGPAVEDDLTERSRRALQKAGLDTVDVRFDGRDAVLTGVPSRHRARATAAVAAVAGVRVVELADATGHLTFVMARDLLTISGRVPDARARTTVVRRASAHAGSRDLVAELVIAPDALLPGNPELVGTLIAWLAQEPAGERTLTWNAEGVRVTGVVTEDETRTAIVDGVTAALPGIRVRADLESKEAKLRSRIAEYLAANPVEFRPYTAEMTANGRSAVRYVASLLVEAPWASVRVDGNVTSVRDGRSESSAYQRTLSGQRAEAVRRLLVSSGVAAERITTRALGQDGTEPGRRADIAIR